MMHTQVHTMPNHLLLFSMMELFVKIRVGRQIVHYTVDVSVDIDNKNQDKNKMLTSV